MTTPQAIETTDPDLILKVTQQTLADGRRALRFSIKTRGFAPYFKDYESRPFQIDPETHFSDLFKDVDDTPKAQHPDWLAGRGAQLCEELLPEDLRNTLWGFCGKARTLLILSDEVWIPWELLRLPDPDDPASGPFLVEAFDITRWLLGPSFVMDFPLQRIALVAPRDATLPSVAAEREQMRSLANPVREVIEIPARFHEVGDALASGQYDGIHFAGHGYDWYEGRRRWSILLEEGEIDPAHLYSRAGRLGLAHPLVFLNACHSGRGTASLTGMGGLASAFIRAGAGAFIGSHWTLSDTQASAFSAELYRHLLAGMSLGAAVRAARLAIRERFPGRHGWLMYTVFAHPLARCSTPPQPVEEPAPEELPFEPPALSPPENPSPGDEWINQKDGTLLLWVPGRDGSPPFWIGRFPVTNEQYAKYLEESHPAREPAFWGNPRFNHPRHPVVGVSWSEARAYCTWAGLELPTEEQWTAAARGEDQRPHPWGRGLPTPLHANFGGMKGGTTPVDAYAAGRGPYGTFDQAGNVWEWCADPETAAAPGDDALRILRGGSWTSPAEDLHVASRTREPARRRLNSVGFRCARRPA